MIDFTSLLSQYGIFDVILPFLLIFSIVFMVLELAGLLKTGPDDEVGRRLNALFALSFALLSIGNQNLIQWLLSFIPNASVAVLGFFLLAMVISISNKKVPGFFRAILGLLVIGIILWLALNALELTPNAGGSSISGALNYIISYLINSGLLAILIIFVLLGITIFWLVSPSKKEDKKEEGTQVIPLLSK
ncbi:hypothetical protein MJ1_0714 [Nanobdella aerobiophila]|uniref:Uncharacterized protein n=1 Tax=Nanobdella aerobiophila TaxID=2586965 RepID=A0A915SLB6_9ARCH|nr:hypothetical protein [Nanobdella aerobiophila]BBL45856.1 hypothetical protein MJ1_0714 [Nanobdella aerobiophila]